MLAVNRFHSSEFFGGAPIPDEWEDVRAFMNWYMTNGMPWMIPWGAEVICSDDATAIALFRKGRWLAELYLVHPNLPVPVHSHPDVESIIVYLGGGEQEQEDEFGMSTKWGVIAPLLKSGETHGGRPFGQSAKGYAMINFQHWPEGVEVTSAAVRWQGDTAGPKQDALIARYFPAAVPVPGFADITACAPTLIL